MSSTRKHNRALLAIAIFKWTKGLLMLAIALGLLKLLHQDVGEMLEKLANGLRADPDNRFLGHLMNKLSLLDDKKIEQLSALTSVYSLLFLTEGTGLFFEKKWAEYLTVIATSSLVPLEVYELVKEFSAVKLLILILNLAIVGFLIVMLRRQRKSK
jgi:uncharacterized membrane protein (DUF2068 family)